MTLRKLLSASSMTAFAGLIAMTMPAGSASAAESADISADAQHAGQGGYHTRPSRSSGHARPSGHAPRQNTRTTTHTVTRTTAPQSNWRGHQETQREVVRREVVRRDDRSHARQNMQPQPPAHRNQTYANHNRNQSYANNYRAQDNHNTNYRRWDNHSWRNNSRYNWSNYRHSNRNLYRLGEYHSPYQNYRYNRVNVGHVLDNLFFGSRYWISDPWTYRLPSVYGPYRWVRYYNDVVLVDTYNGQVVDVINNFFW